MPKAIYTLELELSYNTWTDVTADWAAAAPLVIERGIAPGERVAGVGRLTFALYNPDGRYTPGHANATAGFEAGIGVRLRANDGLHTFTLFTGRVMEIDPARRVEAAGRSSRSTAVVGADDMAALERMQVGAFPLVIDAAPGDLIERLVTISFVPPGRLAYWRLDHPQAGRLGQTSVLSDASTGVDLDAGQSVFPWAGDTWPAGLSALAALREVCASEGGFFYIAADGTPTFDDRHVRPKHIAPDAVLSSTLAGLSIERGQARVANRVEVTAHPREVGASDATLWQAGHSIRIDSGQTRTLVCRYTDPDQQMARVGALSVAMPLPGVDFRATDDQEGAGEDLTRHVRLRLEPGAASARLTLWSAWPGTLYLHSLRLRGTPLRSAYPSTVAVEDAASRFATGEHPLRIDMPLQTDTRVAGDMAHALLARHKDLHPWLTVMVEATADASLLAHALARDVGDRLHLSDATLALDGAACFIERVRHEVRRGGASHRVEWRTSPADLTAFWVLGSSAQAALGQGSRLGY